MDQIRELAAPLEGKRVLHLSATAFGGGVAEILYTLVPLMRDAGLDVEWRIIHGQDEFFDVTKTIHNALQGDPVGLTDEQQEIFRPLPEAERRGARGRSYDFVIVHDPQPVGVIEHARDARPPLDVALPHRPLRAEPRRCSTSSSRGSARHDAAVFHRREYVPGTAASADAVDLAAGHRPAGAEEHGALGRGRGLHRRPVRDRREAAADHAGQPLRPVEGPARRDRGLADRAAARTPRCSSRSSARWRTTTPRAGSTTTARSRRPTATPTSSSSPT